MFQNPPSLGSKWMAQPWKVSIWPTSTNTCDLCHLQWIRPFFQETWLVNKRPSFKTSFFQICRSWAERRSTEGHDLRHIWSSASLKASPFCWWVTSSLELSVPPLVSWPTRAKGLEFRCGFGRLRWLIYWVHVRCLFRCPWDCPRGVCNAYIAQVSAEEDTDCWDMLDGPWIIFFGISVHQCWESCLTQGIWILRHWDSDTLI